MSMTGLEKRRISEDEDFRYWLVANNIESGFFFTLATPSTIRAYRHQYLQELKQK